MESMWRAPGAAKKGLAEWESQGTAALLFLDLQRQGLKGGEATKAATAPACAAKKRLKKKKRIYVLYLGFVCVIHSQVIPNEPNRNFGGNQRGNCYQNPLRVSTHVQLLLLARGYAIGDVSVLFDLGVV
jgi:hypothetical protein